MLPSMSLHGKHAGCVRACVRARAHGHVLLPYFVPYLHGLHSAHRPAVVSIACSRTVLLAQCTCAGRCCMLSMPNLQHARREQHAWPIGRAVARHGAGVPFGNRSHLADALFHHSSSDIHGVDKVPISLRNGSSYRILWYPQRSRAEH